MGEKNKPIPIENLFYMLCYAWNVLSIKDDIQVAGDDYENAYDLLARIFSYGIGKLIRSGFHRSYNEKTEELPTLKGKITVQDNINKLSMQRKKIICTYDDYSNNDIFNQILKYTIDSIIKNPEISKITKNDLKKKAVFFQGIDSAPPTKDNRKKITFNQNNLIYKMLISISIMLYDGIVVNEKEGKNAFKDFFREEQMQKVFELFILNFYLTHLNRLIYKVHAPKINWQIENSANDIWGDIFDVETNPGDRRTDIVIENKKQKVQMIFDAKYYKKTFVESYKGIDEDKIRTSHLNQIRGYLLDSKFEGNKVGALLYPMVNNDLKKGKIFPIQGTHIVIKTINLQDDWKEIKKDMLEFVIKIETGADRLEINVEK